MRSHVGKSEAHRGSYPPVCKLSVQPHKQQFGVNESCERNQGLQEQLSAHDQVICAATQIEVWGQIKPFCSPLTARR